MPTTYEVVAKPDGGYKYRIINNGNTECVQEYKPGTSGYKDMTQAEAQMFASAIATNKNTPPEPVLNITISHVPSITNEKKITDYISSLGFTSKKDK